MLSGFAVEVKVFIVMHSFLHTHIHHSLAREIHPPKPLRITQPKFFTRVNEAQSIVSFLVLLFTTTRYDHDQVPRRFCVPRHRGSVSQVQNTLNSDSYSI